MGARVRQKGACIFSLHFYNKIGIKMLFSFLWNKQESGQGDLPCLYIEFKDFKKSKKHKRVAAIALENK